MQLGTIHKSRELAGRLYSSCQIQILPGRILKYSGDVSGVAFRTMCVCCLVWLSAHRSYCWVCCGQRCSLGAGFQQGYSIFPWKLGRVPEKLCSTRMNMQRQQMKDSVTFWTLAPELWLQSNLMLPASCSDAQECRVPGTKGSLPFSEHHLYCHLFFLAREWCKSTLHYTLIISSHGSQALKRTQDLGIQKVLLSCHCTTTKAV